MFAIDTLSLKATYLLNYLCGQVQAREDSYEKRTDPVVGRVYKTEIF